MKQSMTARILGGLALGIAAFTGNAVGTESSSKKTLTPERLWQLERLSGGSYSPDGQWILYSVRGYDVKANSGDSDLFLVSADGTRSVALLDGDESESAAQWVKTAKGVRVFFTSKREGDEASQVYSLDPESKALHRVTTHKGGVSNLKVSPTGTHVAFTSNVKLDATPNELYADLPKADARIIDGLLYRHWSSWHDYAYSHLFVAELNDDLVAAEAHDLMKGKRLDCPVPPFGGSDQFTWSPDGKEIAYTTKVSNEPALSTDTGVYVIDIETRARSRCLTPGMPGYDMSPIYSPDGRYIAFQSMERAGFEADRNRIMIYDRQKDSLSEVTKGLDQTTHDIVWHRDSKGVYFRSEWRGTDQIFSRRLGSDSLTQLTHGAFNWSLRDLSPDGKTMLLGQQSMIRPWELGTMPTAGGSWTKITKVNDAIYADMNVATVRERWTKTTDGKKLHSWVIYPPGFDPNKSWPMLTYCQGGPQGQIGQWFSYRWNFHLMAAQGYVVLAVNRRGLPGFGREWNDSISLDYGGQAMQDILAATDDMMMEPYIDKKRVGAIGASFGGYTVFWLMGNHKDRFCTMIAHAGLFNLESFYGSTEETFFPNWDLGGPYWASDEIQRDYDRFSPHTYVGNWKTPLLVIHGQKDFRVPVTQGMEAFTAAQLQGVPSRFLYFPEENHWILSPQNAILWHRVFFDWLARSCQPKG